MISKERLKELIEQEAKIYCVFAGKVCEVHLWNVEYPNDYYETKEEAEFVAKYHCSKTIKFEPPTFEEFMNLEIKSIRLNNVGISLGYRRFEVSEYYYNTSDFGFRYFNVEDESKESRKQAYYQAVEYAKKLFLGENDEQE